MTKRILFPALAALAAIVGFAFAWGSGLWAFIDPPALLLVPGAGTLYAFLAFGAKPGFGAFSAAFDPKAPKTELDLARRFFDCLGRSYAAFAFLGFVIGMVSMMINLQDRTKLGPNLAFATISLEYAALLFLLLVLPFKTALERRLAEGA